MLSRAQGKSLVGIDDINWHEPQPIDQEDIFNMYNRVIDYNFLMNQQVFSSLIKHHRSVYSKVNTDFIALERQTFHQNRANETKTSK